MSREEYAVMEALHGRVVHRCPRRGDSGIMPCCGRTPFEVPRWHRIAIDPALVTCCAEDRPVDRKSGPQESQPASPRGDHHE